MFALKRIVGINTVRGVFVQFVEGPKSVVKMSQSFIHPFPHNKEIYLKHESGIL
jgi:hypothetical protein